RFPGHTTTNVAFLPEVFDPPRYIVGLPWLQVSQGIFHAGIGTEDLDLSKIDCVSPEAVPDASRLFFCHDGTSQSRNSFGELIQPAQKLIGSVLGFGVKDAFDGR